jgi:hypothetical protein
MVTKYIRIIVSSLLVLLAIGSCVLYNKNQNLKEELSISISNEKAFIAENSSLKNENRVFKFTVEQLNYYNDSILQKMNDVRKELKIKDDNLKQMQYLLSEATKKDTIVYTCDVSNKNEVEIASVGDITSTIPKSTFDKDNTIDFTNDYSYNYALVRVVDGTATDIVVYENYND